MVGAFQYYWFHLVPRSVVEQFGPAMLLHHLEGFPRVALEQAYYVQFALPHLSRVVPVAGNWQDVPMGQDVLLDSQAVGSFRVACEAMIGRLESARTDDNASGSALLAALRTLVRFSRRLQQGNVNLFVAHWPEREIAEQALGEDPLLPLTG
jgi:hypothetical protein